MIPQLQHLIQNAQHGRSATRPEKMNPTDFDAAIDDLASTDDLPTDIGAGIQALIATVQLRHDLPSLNEGPAGEKDGSQIANQDVVDVQMGDVATDSIAETVTDPTLAMLAADLLPQALGLSQSEPTMSAEGLRGVGLIAPTGGNAVSRSDLQVTTPQVHPAAAAALLLDNSETAAGEADLQAQTGTTAERKADTLEAHGNSPRVTFAEQAWFMRLDGRLPGASQIPRAEIIVDGGKAAPNMTLSSETDQQPLKMVVSAPVAGLQAALSAQILSNKLMNRSTDHMLQDSNAGDDLTAINLTPADLSKLKDTIKKPMLGSVLEKADATVNEMEAQSATNGPQNDGILPKEQTTSIEEPLHFKKSDGDLAAHADFEPNLPVTMGSPLHREPHSLGVQSQIEHMEKLQSPRTASLSAPLFVQQLLHHSSVAKNGGVELVVSPAELGHVKFQIHQQADTMRIVLSAERTETIDLLRRNAEQLLQEFRQSGFTDASLSFEQWNQQGKPSQQATQAAAFFDEDLALNSHVLATPAPISNVLPAGRGLDLRL